MKIMYTVCAAALAAVLVAPFAEGAVKAKDVPPLLVTDAGKTVSDAKEWESARRSELKTWFLENEYGVPPAAAKAPDVTFADAAPPEGDYETALVPEGCFGVLVNNRGRAAWIVRHASPYDKSGLAVFVR